MKFAEVPVNCAHKKSPVYAFVGFVGQTTGPFLPKKLFVFATRGERIFMVSSTVQSQIDQIPECKDVWEQFEKKASEAFDTYSASQLEDKDALNDSYRYQKEGFKAYRDCFSRKAKLKPFFASLMRQAQSMADRIQRD